MKFVSQDENIRPKKHFILKIAGKVSIIFSIVLVALIILLLCIMAIIINGPSKSARDIFVTTCMETSFAKIFPPMYLSEIEIEDIIKSNNVVDIDDVTDVQTLFEEPVKDKTQDDIEIYDVVGGTYKGKMMIVKDPSRVTVSGTKSYGEESQGIKLEELLKTEKAIAGINGGGFVDENGVGNGGIPLGIVVRNSQFIYGGNGGSTSVIGFDQNNVLHVGNMTSEQVRERKIRDAVSFGPALIVNSTPIKTVGNSGGLNPRTAIGQRKDGSVLLLVIDGRQPHSLGANFKDLVDIMTEYEAVNAGNLDGGSSSMLYYNGELISTCASLYGPRKIPTAFIVK